MNDLLKETPTECSTGSSSKAVCGKCFVQWYRIYATIL